MNVFCNMYTKRLNNVNSYKEKCELLGLNLLVDGIYSVFLITSVRRSETDEALCGYQTVKLSSSKSVS